MSKKKRFMFVKSEESGLGLASTAQVVVDRETGVNYLFVHSGYSGGLTPLLDRTGKPIVSPLKELDEA